MHRLARRLSPALFAAPVFALVAACGAAHGSGPTPAESSAAASASARAEAHQEAAAVHAAQAAAQKQRQVELAGIDAWLSRAMTQGGIARADQLQGHYGAPAYTACLDGYRYLFASGGDRGLSAAVHDAATAEGWTSAPAEGPGETRFTKGTWELWIVQNHYPDSSEPDTHGPGVDISVRNGDTDCGV